MNMKEFYLNREAEYLNIAKSYERVPEDEQKAAGAKDARAQAAYYRSLAEQKTLTRCGYCWRDEDRKPYYWDEEKHAMVSAETNTEYVIVRHIVEDECTVRENT